MFGAQGGYQPPPQQMSAPTGNGPPPAKKMKGNPIITRYPPPPGYQPPPQQPRPYQQQTWQQPPNAAYGYGQQAHPGYPPQAYGQPQIPPQSQWPPHGQPQHQWQGYHQPPNAGYPPGYYPPQAQTWSGAPPAWPPSAPPSTSPQIGWQGVTTPQPQSAPLQNWPPQTFMPSTEQRHNSAPSLNTDSAPAGSLDGTGRPLSPRCKKTEVGHELDEPDYYGECYFLRHPDEIDPEFSLGDLMWYPATPGRLALPSTFKENEVEIIAPRRTPPPDENSVSEYFFREKRDEALLSIRHMDEWFKIKDDLIFKVFTTKPSSTLTVSEMLKKYKDRPDPTWIDRAPSATPEPEIYCEAAKGDENVVDGAMDVDRNYTADQNTHSQALSEDGDVLGSLQQALDKNQANQDARHSRANSVTSNVSHHSTKLKPLMPVKDRAQDDILAALGVTGSPKMVYQTPGPAFGAPPPARDGSTSQDHSRRGSVVSNSEAPRIPPPPPGQPLQYAQRPSNHNNWAAGGQPYRNGYNAARPGSRGGSRPVSRPGSSASQHTASGSDFGARDEERTPRPKYHRTDSRKRGYEEDGQDGSNGIRDRDEDATPRAKQQQRYKQPRTEDPWYSRRW